MLRKAKKMMQDINVERIQHAIAEAERASTGEIRVSIAPFFWGSVRRRAEEAFARLGMTNTRQHNGVLFFVVPSRRRLAVLGDEGIHARVGQAFWDSVVADATVRFHGEAFTGGLVDAIERVAEALAEFFPRTGANVNELPDQLDYAPPEPSDVTTFAVRCALR